MRHNIFLVPFVALKRGNNHFKLLQLQPFFLFQTLNIIYFLLFYFYFLLAKKNNFVDVKILNFTTDSCIHNMLM